MWTGHLFILNYLRGLLKQSATTWRPLIFAEVCASVKSEQAVTAEGFGLEKGIGSVLVALQEAGGLLHTEWSVTKN